ncbi:MAG: hypothetical protein AAFY88_11385, partial [Acidobacteriota bacterium]
MKWRWLEAVFSRCLPADRAEDAVGDLIELYPERARRFGLLASWLTLADAFFFLATVAVAGVRDRIRDALTDAASVRFEVRLARRPEDHARRRLRDAPAAGEKGLGDDVAVGAPCRARRQATP